VIHIPNGISISTFIRQSSNAIILVFAAGRILPSKGCHVFLQSLNLLTFRGQVKVIGDYNQMPQYKNELLALSNALNVVFIGLVKDRNELYKNLCVATLFVYPSKIESMSMMLLEVASLKIPIICSDIQENKDIFDASEVLFFKTDDVLDLSQKITWALNHIDKMNRMAERAFKKVSIHFNWNTIAYKYDSIYSQFIKSD
jgi:glycosyltransferase involved in cell wall biosynthesis